jgi:hypothetical protein
VRVVVVAAAVTMLAAACARDDEPSTTSRGSRPQVAVEGLCKAEALAAQGQQDEARKVFQDQSHAYLHELAAQLQERNRALAAQLLEAKQQVERSLEGGVDPEILAGLIGALRAVVESALATMGRANVGCFK